MIGPKTLTDFMGDVQLILVPADIDKIMFAAMSEFRSASIWDEGPDLEVLRLRVQRYLETGSFDR